MEFPFGGFINSNHILMELLFKAGEVGIGHWEFPVSVNAYGGRVGCPCGGEGEEVNELGEGHAKNYDK